MSYNTNTAEVPVEPTQLDQYVEAMKYNLKRLCELSTELENIGHRLSDTTHLKGEGKAEKEKSRVHGKGHLSEIEILIEDQRTVNERIGLQLIKLSKAI